MINNSGPGVMTSGMEKASVKNKKFYKNRKVFVTGHTGFKGSWLTAILYALGADAMGYALTPVPGSLFEKINGDGMIKNIAGDVRDYQHLRNSMYGFNPEIVIHLAAQAIVQDCFENPRYAFDTNVMGTVNLFESIRDCQSVRSVVIVTSDKVYENKGDGTAYVESDPLGGTDPYSGSKTCMEYITNTYKHSYLQTADRLVGLSTVRASNVLAGGDHIQTRLIPSALHAIEEGRPIQLRNPRQTRPWQSALDALNGYLAVGRLMYQNPAAYSGQWNIGPDRDGIREVQWVIQKIQDFYGKQTGYHYQKPDSPVKESETLGLDITKSLKNLDWRPELSCDEMLSEVVEFFKAQQAGQNEREICLKQIKRFYDM